MPNQPEHPSSDTRPKLTPAATIARLGLIGIVLALILGAFAYAGGWLTPDKLTPGKFVSRLEGGGVHPGFRRNHAKGVCFTGHFQGNGNGAKVSKASVFAAETYPVIGRFALAGPVPDAPDSPTIQSMALRFMLPGDQEWRTGMNDIPVFIVKTPADFYDFMAASAPDPATGKPDDNKMKAFIGAHPETGKAFGLIGAAQPKPTGFADAPYNSLDAFLLVDAEGHKTPVRWAMVPLQSPRTEANADKNYLFDAFVAQAKEQKLQWRLVLTLGQPGDPTADATAPWPAGHQTVDAGTLTIDAVEGEDTGSCRDVNYDPLVLPDGIAPSDDPLLSARSAAYARSFTKRAGEPKTPSAVSTDGSQK